jgi:hypothetical protein
VTSAYARRFVIPAAYAVLPPEMASEDATRELLAIGYQESRFEHRYQVRGPAKSFWQFEQRGVSGVLAHVETYDVVRRALVSLNYRNMPTPFSCQLAIEHNDVLACVFARLLLWTLPNALPKADEPEEGWRQYLAAWRPGKPHPETWSQSWLFAQEKADG